jgi:hypothetical protein
VTRPDPLGVECPWKYCRSKPGQRCSTIAEDGPRRGDFVERKPHAARVRAAEKKEKEENHV